MTDKFEPAEMLQQHRPLLLAMEAIGWFHMAGKAKAEFLRHHGGESMGYDYKKWHDLESPPFPWDDLLRCIKNNNWMIPQDAWPDSFKDFTEKHTGKNNGLLGLLQGAHGIVSGVEKNIPNQTSKYLGQSVSNMWLSSPFGCPKHNLLQEPPEVLTEDGWGQLVSEMQRVLEGLRELTINKIRDPVRWAEWREEAIGQNSFIHRAFLSTIAETRLPNNDVTLWDQSYVAAALCKSAVAGAILAGSNFPWDNNDIKYKLRWRLLTIAIGTEHYEARAVKIGDWTGVNRVINNFFKRVSHLIEVDLAIGSLIYQDTSIAVFTFPGEWFDEGDQNNKFNEKFFVEWLNGWDVWLQGQVDDIAKELELETPPLVRLSAPTRSLVPLKKERQEAIKAVAAPIHRRWEIQNRDPPSSRGHVCPVCHVRLNDDLPNKQRPCKVCRDRRYHRRNDWLNCSLGYDTIWFEEVADANGRLALLTFSLDLSEWLSGEQVDSLRSQAIPEWREYNPTLCGKREKQEPNPIDINDPYNSIRNYIKKRLSKYDKNDCVLKSLQDGYKYEEDWERFFMKIVEDRADAPNYQDLNDTERATWLTHQLFCKLPSSGRIYRFWREGKEFFDILLEEFRKIASRDSSGWRTRRLLLLPDQEKSDGRWRDLALYDGRWRGVQLSLIYVQSLGGFVTASNLARMLRRDESADAFYNQEILLEEEDTSSTMKKRLVINSAMELNFIHPHLNTYYPVIPIERSPLRFRVIVPLESASACVNAAIQRWKKIFGRVWDRLPLRVAVVGFPRLTPFQAVIEAMRNLEERISSSKETWIVEEKGICNGVVGLRLLRSDGRSTLRMVPIAMPDGREDVFYPYLAVEDTSVRYPRDFRHPNGNIYRHVADLRPGDGISVVPATIAFMFMSSTSARFFRHEPIYLEEWEEMQEIWQLLKRIALSQTSLQKLRYEIHRVEHNWKNPPSDLRRDTLRALLVNHLKVKGAALNTLAEAAVAGVLVRVLDWYISVLKEGIEEDK